MPWVKNVLKSSKTVHPDSLSVSYIFVDCGPEAEQDY